MTYLEAQKFIEDNRQKAIDINSAKRPFIAIKGFFVAHPRILNDYSLRQVFYERCIMNAEDNQHVLLDFSNDYFTDQLEPFIVIETKGTIATLSMKGYIEGNS
jgi:hypothetical protein